MEPQENKGTMLDNDSMISSRSVSENTLLFDSGSKVDSESIRDGFSSSGENETSPSQCK